MEQIKNDQLTVEISSLGAELQSIKDANGNEYLWDGDPEYWGRHSPLLFPIVGGLWKDTYRIDDKEYTPEGWLQGHALPRGRLAERQQHLYHLIQKFN